MPRHPRPASISAGAARVLAELLAAAALLASTLKFKGSLIVQLQGDGPGAPARRRMHRRRWACAPPRSGTRARRARCRTTRTLARSPAARARAASRSRSTRRTAAPLYQGIVALEAASVAALIEHYLATSEQIDSRLVLATRCGAARAACCCSGCRAPAPTTTPPGGTRRRGVDARRPPDAARAPSSAEALLAARFPARRHARVRRRGPRASTAPARASAWRTRCGCRPRRDRKHPRRARRRRRDLRILQSPLQLSSPRRGASRCSRRRGAAIAAAAMRSEPSTEPDR